MNSIRNFSEPWLGPYGSFVGTYVTRIHVTHSGIHFWRSSMRSSQLLLFSPACMRLEGPVPAPANVPVPQLLT